jgi:hypothetical protein
MATDNPIGLVLIDYHHANGETGEQVARDMRLLKRIIQLVMLTGDVLPSDRAFERVYAVLAKGLSSQPYCSRSSSDSYPTRSCAHAEPNVDSEASSEAISTH